MSNSYLREEKWIRGEEERRKRRKSGGINEIRKGEGMRDYK